MNEELRKQWFSEFRTALRKRNVQQYEVADAVGLSRTTVSTYVTGKKVPKHTTSIKIADFLGWPAILEVSVKLHSSSCRVCGRQMLDAGQQHKKAYCSAACRSTAHTRKSRERRSGQSAVRANYVARRLAVFQEVVDAYCRSCTDGEAVCRDSSCGLREVSPLPLVKRPARRIA